MTIQGQQLHDQVTRGEKLTPDEQAALEQWYSQEDHTEGMVLNASVAIKADGSLQRHVDATLDQLRLVTQQIQELSIENDTIRREITELRRRLAQRLASRAA
jgi:hypothetical protein